MNVKYISACFLLLGTSFLGSCSNDVESDELVKDKDALIPVNIVMKGYQELEDATGKTRGASGTLPTIQVAREDMDIPGFEMVTTIESTPIKDIQTRANMNVNSRFRMLIYDANGLQKGDCQYQVNGTTATLVQGENPFLPQGTYKFVCYTNNSNAVSVYNAINVVNGDDFATCCVTKVISATDNTVPIAFVRQMAQIQISATATGFTDNTITFTSAEVNSIPALGTWEVSNNSTDAIGLTVSGSSILSCVSGTPYKIIPISAAMDITLKNLVVRGKNEGDRTIKATTVFEKGKNYKVTISFQKKTYIQLAGLNWAIGNLVKKGTDYVFYDNQEECSYVWNGGDYFNFNTLDPMNYKVSVVGSVWKTVDDPCAQVAPAGTWRTPTAAEMKKLIDLPTVWGQLNGQSGRYFGANNELFLPASGWRYKTTSTVSTGVGALYWTSTPNGNSGSASAFGFQNKATNLDLQDIVL